MTLKTLAAAATLAVFATTGVNAATFDFSFNASGADSGDTSLTAVGTLDINVGAGLAFTSSDISNVLIVVESDFFASALLVDPLVVTGSLSADGGTAAFTDFFITDGGSAINFGCRANACSSGDVFFGGVPGADGTEAGFATSAAALETFQSTAQVGAVPLPAGGLLLLSGLGGVAALKRRKKRAA